MTDIYLHIDARMNDYIRTHLILAVGGREQPPVGAEPKRLDRLLRVAALEDKLY